MTTPSPVLGEQLFATIAVGFSHSCALTVQGAAYCWGRTFDDSGASIPTPVPAGGEHRYVTLSVARAGVACGTTAAGASYCWGLNRNGQFGNGEFTSTAAPMDVPEAGALGLTLASLSLGETHACAITTTSAVYCWGWGEYGELGTALAPLIRTLPVSLPGNIIFRYVQD